MAFRNLSGIGWPLLACLSLLSAELAFGAEISELDWPRQIEFDNGVIILYQPQPDAFDGNRLEGRAAVVVELDDQEPAFGAIWMTADLHADQDERIATIRNVDVTRVRFPNVAQDKEAKLKAFVEQHLDGENIQISLDRLLATLELVESRAAAVANLRVSPPAILVVTDPTVLISIDGQPRLQPEPETSLMRVINTAFSLLYDPALQTYFLFADSGVWYQSQEVEGNWTIATEVPEAVAALAPEAESIEVEADELEADEPAAEPRPAPSLIVVSEPSELVVLDGDPQYAPIGDTDLMYISNTDSDLLLHSASREYYLLLSGRWFASASLDGPWRYVPGLELPEDFALIPEASEAGNVLYAVPGTVPAKEAVMDAQIPQTAAIERDKATLNVEYDGTPRFESISGTTMLYATNTATPLIIVDRVYYGVDEGVWFRANSSSGPWVVATTVPQTVYTIPP